MSQSPTFMDSNEKRDDLMLSLFVPFYTSNEINGLDIAKGTKGTKGTRKGTVKMVCPFCPFYL